jgi:hypothetical protein
MNKLKLNESFTVQISDKNSTGIYATIIDRTGTEVLGGYFENGTKDEVIKIWAETKIKQLSKF